jgi:hypothetical protein
VAWKAQALKMALHELRQAREVPQEESRGISPGNRPSSYLKYFRLSLLSIKVGAPRTRVKDKPKKHKLQPTRLANEFCLLLLPIARKRNCSLWAEAAPTYFDADRSEGCIGFSVPEDAAEQAPKWRLTETTSCIILAF